MVAGAAAHAATLMKVRIGNHPDKTRVVLETDGAARYRVASHRADEILVRLSADAVPEAIAGNGSPLLWVRVEPRIDGTDVRLQVASNVIVKEMVLEGPDRIVLDLVRGPARAAAPAPREPAPPAVRPTPVPEPEPVVALEPEPEVAAGGPAAEPAVEPVEEPAEVPGAGALEPFDPLASDPAFDPDAEFGAEAEVRPIEVEAVERNPDTPSRPAGAPPPARRGGPLAILGNPIVLGAGALLVALLAFWALRRRSRADDDEDDYEEADDAPPVAADATTGSIGAALSSSEASSAPTEPFGEGAGDNGSIFDVAESEVVVAEDADEDDFPAIPGVTPAPTIAPAPAAAEPLDTSELGDDMAAIVKELERRMAHLETRLEEVVDSKERLERQVSAQTEELRVQRAAIARTQRVLRGISRPEDDGGDPAPK